MTNFLVRAQYFGRGAVVKYCDEYVCVSVYLSTKISPKPYVRSLPNVFFCILPVTMALSSWRHCNTVFTCVFVDGIIFCYSGLYSDMNFVTKDQFS